MKSFVQKLPLMKFSKKVTCIKAVFVSLICFFTVFANATQCPGDPQKVIGTVYCDNKFSLWVNGELVATDPINFTPHQAVEVSFDWDGVSSITYAIQCEDYASISGYEYVESHRPQLGDGALIAEFNDGLSKVTSAEWRVYTSTYGPTDDSYLEGCSANNLDKCSVKNLGMPNNWISPEFDDSLWHKATLYSAETAGWGRPPQWSPNKGCCTLTSPEDRSSLGCDASVNQKQCLDPRDEFSKSAADFIWASDLERDNKVLFRYTATCDGA